MKRLIAISCMTILGITFADAQSNQILVTPQWVNEHLQDPDLVMLQVNFSQLDFDIEHIAGARFLWPEWLAPNSPTGTFNAPDPKKAADILRKLGVSNSSHVIVYHTRNQVTVTARMFLTLEYLGLRGQVSFLNGGLEAWKKAGYPVSKEAPIVKKGKFKVIPNTLLVDKDYVVKTLANPSAVVVDARMQRFYDGEPTGNPRDGHITGAKNIPYPDLIDQTSNMFKPDDQLQAYFTPVVPAKTNEVVTYCFIGQTASVVYMAGRVLGYDIKLYDGSLEEWSRLDQLPMETTKK